MKIEKQSVGEIFKEARKEKGLTLEEISKETNIPKRYLEAIENDNFSVFSSETYAIGFVSNYAEALEIDKELVLSQYRRLKKIEEDSPIQELVGERKLNVKKFIYPSVIGVLSLIFIALFFFIIKTQMRKSSLPKSYNFSIKNISKIYDIRFKLGDKIYITNETRTSELVFEEIDKMNNLNFKINNNAYSIKGTGIVTIDSDYDGTNDMHIEFFSTKPNYIRLNISYINPLNQPSQLEKPTGQAGSAIISQREWYKGESQKEIVVKILALDTSWIAYKADDKEEKNVPLYEKSEHIILFSQSLTLYSGNSGAIKINIEGKEDTLGGQGEVNKSIFYWTKKDKDFLLMQSILR